MSENTNPETITIPDSSDNSSAMTPEEAIESTRKALAVILGFSETAKQAAQAAGESQRAILAMLTDAQAKLSEIASVATQAVAARTQITDEQSVIATKSAHIQSAQDHADKVRADLDRALTSATQSTTEAEGLRSRTQTAADAAGTLVTTILTIKGSVETDASAIGTARKAAEESTAATKSLADKASTTDTRLAAYETRLNELGQQCTSQLKKIEALLPGATSAGLAHAFNERRQTFLKPHNRWQWLFVGSVLAIVALAATGLWQVYKLQTAPSYDELVRLWLSRLPIAGALVWLALHSSRESALAKRLEEDYGYKSAIASCFEGFQKQMSELETTVAPDSPVAKLCANTLSTIATPPGRIYDKHELTVSPTSELEQVAKTVTNVVTTPKTPS